MALSSSFAISDNKPTLHHTLQFNTFKTPSLEQYTLPILRKTRSFRIPCTAPDPFAGYNAPLENPAFDDPSKSEISGGDVGGDGVDGDGDGGRVGGGNDGDEEFGALLNFEAVMEKAEARDVKLPSDMVEAVKITGIREVFLHCYLELQGSRWPLSFLMKHCSMLRNRMLADPSFLFKVGAEIVIDSLFAMIAKMKKRGNGFLNEFELFPADLLVGIVVDIALVGMLAPSARIGKPSSMSRGLCGRIQHAIAALPNSVFEAERPGCKFSVKQRSATYMYKGALQGILGFLCGLAGQGIANMIMIAKRCLSWCVIQHSLSNH